MEQNPPCSAAGIVAGSGKVINYKIFSWHDFPASLSSDAEMRPLRTQSARRRNAVRAVQGATLDAHHSQSLKNAAAPLALRGTRGGK